MDKIKWIKPTWINKGNFQYRLDRKSSCGKWIIHRWNNDNRYFIAMKYDYYGMEAWEIIGNTLGVRLFDSLKEAKCFCEVYHG